jgi:arylsulfatase A
MFRLLSALALLLAGAVPVWAAPATKPNIVLIMVDDFGFECVGCNGGGYKTPNIDRLAAGGVRFTNAHSMPLCTPTRVQIMTGRYNCRNYVRFGQFPFGERTFAHLLKDAGYATFIAGKWQLNGGLKGPNELGFDEYCFWQIFTENKGSRFANPKIHANGKLLTGLEKAYGPDIFEQHIEDFVSRHKDQPFFVYWPMVLTHAPFEPTPDSRPGGKQNNQTNFRDMVEYMDKLVGKFDAHLQKLGVRDNTLLIFTGDNGTGRPIRSTLNGKPVQGGKGTTTVYGTHAPLVVNWPAAGVKGKVCDDLIDFTDVLPTLVAAGGAKPPSGAALDGRSFLPQIKGEKGHPREWIFCHYEPRHGPNNSKTRFVHDKEFKLYQDGRLIDLNADELEKSPIPEGKETAAAAAARKKLQAVFDRFEKESPYGKQGTEE